MCEPLREKRRQPFLRVNTAANCTKDECRPACCRKRYLVFNFAVSSQAPGLHTAANQNANRIWSPREGFCRRAAVTIDSAMASASIYKHVRGNTPYWIGVFRDHTGKQRHRSTRTQDRGQALEVCQRWQREANELGKGRRLQNKGLVMETFIAATQAAEKGEMTEAIVRKMLNELLVASGHSPMHHATVRDYLTAWMNSKEAAKSSRNREEIPPHGFDVH